MSSRRATLPSLAALSSLVLGAACGPTPDPVYDEDLDLQAEAVPPGSLAGTFALFTRAVGPIATPLGQTPSGNDDWILVERTWDPIEQVYGQTSEVCGGVHIPVLETQTVIPADTWRLVPRSVRDTVEVDHARGTFTMRDHLQLWGLAGFDDPLDDPLPETRDAALEPTFLEHVVDLDEDDNVGVTFLTEGLVDGEVYAVQRKTSHLDGLVLSEDRLAGRSDHLYEFIVIEALPSILEGPPQFNGTDLEQSWFEEVRLDEGSDCDDVQALVDEGTLGERPF